MDKVTGMRNALLLMSLALLPALAVSQTSSEFESAEEAVANMCIGWNMGNTLDSNSGDTLNMWIEYYNKGSKRTTSVYETAWGQPVTKPELFRMLKNAGFNAVRVPVTWYPHMEAKFDNLHRYGDGKIYWYPSKDDIGTRIDAKWMARVHEIVDYVLDAGLYCILNVHHDTGAASTAWLIADRDNYNREHERFEAVWTQIAEEFRDYDEHLLFEGYNEMLDKYRSWCYASSGAPGSYDTNTANGAYAAINSYAQSFVNAVRATGGNNRTRNLIVTTYGACCGSGDWNAHLTDPLSNMKLPKDEIAGPGHIAFEVHAYPDATNINRCKEEMKSMFSRLKVMLAMKGAPVIIGEWGTSDMTDSSIVTPKANKLEFMEYFVSQAKAKGMATFYWMELTDGKDRSVPEWTHPDYVDAIVKGYYGPGGYDGVTVPHVDNNADCVYYDLLGRAVRQPLKPGLYIHGGRKVLISDK